MSFQNCYLEGKFNIKSEDYVTLKAYLLFELGELFENSDLELEPSSNCDEVKFRLETGDAKNVSEFIRYVNRFGNFDYMGGSIEDCESRKNSINIRFINDKVMEQRLESQELYTEYCDYDFFQEKLLKLGDDGEFDELVVNMPNFDYQKFYHLIKSSEDMAKLGECLEKTFGFTMERNEDYLKIEDRYFCGIEYEKIIMVLYVGHDGQLKVQMDYEKLSLEETNENGGYIENEFLNEKVELPPCEGDKEIMLKVTFPNKGIRYVTLFETLFEELIVRDEFKIEIQTKDGWFNPCEICVNRIKRQVDGCSVCVFQEN